MPSVLRFCRWRDAENLHYVNRAWRSALGAVFNLPIRSGNNYCVGKGSRPSEHPDIRLQLISRPGTAHEWALGIHTASRGISLSRSSFPSYASSGDDLRASSSIELSSSVHPVSNPASIQRPSINQRSIERRRRRDAIKLILKPRVAEEGVAVVT